MTDKTKLEEGATLSLSAQNGEMTSETTISADDVATLAQILKYAGIAGNSATFNGAATLTLDVEENGGRMNTTIQAPDLRSIMHLLEPEFAELGDAEAEVADEPEMEVPAETPADAQDDMSMDMEPADLDVDLDGAVDVAPAGEEMVDEQSLNENEDDDVFDILDYAISQVAAGKTEGSDQFDLGDDLAECHWVATQYVEDNYDADDSVVSNLMAKYGVDEPYQSGVWNDDARELSVIYIIQSFGDIEESTEMQPYAGIADRKPVQAATKEVPARSGDNPMKGFKDYFKETTERNFVVPKPAVTADSLMMEFHKRRMPPTGLTPCDFKSVAMKAREQSREGYVQHVDRHSDGSHSISDWMSDDTIASFSHGNHVGGKDIEEEQAIDEVSDQTKNSYFKKAAADINNHANHAANMRGIGNDEQADKHDRHIMKRAQGMNRAIYKPGK